MTLLRHPTTYAPIEAMPERFMTAVRFLPESISAAAPALGLCMLSAMRGVHHPRGREDVFQQFVDAQLDGPALEAAVEQTKAEHDQLTSRRGLPPIPHEALAQKLPFVYGLAKMSFLTAIAELGKGDAGQAHDTTPPRLDMDTSYQARMFLIEDPKASEHASAALDLTRFTMGALRRRPASTQIAAYRRAILHRLPFPDGAPADETTHDKRGSLAALLRPAVTERLMARHPQSVTPAQTATFAHNIVRPY